MKCDEKPADSRNRKKVSCSKIELHQHVSWSSPDDKVNDDDDDDDDNSWKV